MMRSVIRTITAALLAATAASADQSAARFAGVAGQTAAEREVRAAEEQMHQAYVTGDVALFSSLYAEDGTFTYNSGETVSAKERAVRFVEQARTGSFGDLRDEIVSIKVLRDVALVRCTSRYRSRTGAADTHLNILRVWQKRAGRWQVVAYQSTAVRPAQTAS